MRLEINYKGKKIQKTHKHTEIKQHATEESMCQWRNQRGNQKLPGDKENENTTL